MWKMLSTFKGVDPKVLCIITGQMLELHIRYSGLCVSEKLYWISMVLLASCRQVGILSQLTDMENSKSIPISKSFTTIRFPN